MLHTQEVTDSSSVATTRYRSKMHCGESTFRSRCGGLLVASGPDSFRKQKLLIDFEFYRLTLFPFPDRRRQLLLIFLRFHLLEAL